MLYGKLDGFDLEEKQIVIDVEAAALDLDAERQALEVGGDEMEERERETIEWFIQRAERTATADFRLGPIEAPSFRGLKAEAKRDLVRQAFDEIARKREAAVSRALGAVGGGPSD